MHAWRVHEYGPFDKSLQWEACERPQADGNTAVIKVKAVGVNFADLLAVQGKYQVKMPLPFTPGSEAAGEVVEVGEDSPFKVGDRVMTFLLAGAFGEYVQVLEQSTYPIPDGMSYAQAAAFPIIYQTSYFGLHYRANLKAGEVLLVHAGAGGVGTAAIQLGKAAGATVIATAGSPEKLEICKQCGADHIINYREEDFVSVVKSVTGGKGADVIYDPVGGEVFEKSTKCIAWEGRILVIGFASGNIPSITANRILLKNISVVGLFWGNYQFQNPGLIRETHTKLCELFDAGKIAPVLYQPDGKNGSLQDLTQAMKALGSRKSYGKIVLETD